VIDRSQFAEFAWNGTASQLHIPTGVYLYHNVMTVKCRGCLPKLPHYVTHNAHRHGDYLRLSVRQDLDVDNKSQFLRWYATFYDPEPWSLREYSKTVDWDDFVRAQWRVFGDELEAVEKQFERFVPDLSLLGRMP
jgi:hypothetical protein